MIGEGEREKIRDDGGGTKGISLVFPNYREREKEKEKLFIELPTMHVMYMVCDIKVDVIKNDGNIKRGKVQRSFLSLMCADEFNHDRGREMVF